jgi:ubiquinone/menaquinone biosynthesis C-methylase UbiE
MSLRADQREWDHLAAEDAMFAICSIPGSRGKWSREQFFAAGESEIEAVLAGLETQGWVPVNRRALDFGCGLGRLSRALSTRFEEVWGVDVSPEMIRGAQRLNEDRPSCRFVLNDRGDLNGIPSDGFDLVLSLITLQHVTRADPIRSYVREFVRVAAPGGYVVFQLPVHVSWRARYHPARVASRLLWASPVRPKALRTALSGHATSLSALPEHEVRAILTAAGAEVLAAFPDNRGGTDAIVSYTYVAHKPPPSLTRPRTRPASGREA